MKLDKNLGSAHFIITDLNLSQKWQILELQLESLTHDSTSSPLLMIAARSVQQKNESHLMASIRASEQLLLTDYGDALEEMGEEGGSPQKEVVKKARAESLKG